jgi:hypothetical protein
MADTGGWDAREINGRSNREPADTAPWDVRDMADTGGWDAREINGRTPPGPAETGAWDARQTGETGGWDARQMGDTGGWDAREVAPANRREVTRWDPQDTVVWDPVNAGEWDQPGRPQGAGGLDARPAPGREPAEAVPLSPRTPDAAAVWHGSPAPEDAGLWSPPEPVNRPATPSRLAIAGTPAPAASPDLRPGSRPDAAHDPHAAAATPIADPVMARNSATPSEYAAIAGRSVGRRSGRKARVTTQAIFSQLLELASIPQSAYAVDDEVDGAMCLIRAKGGYEVFSLADQSRHEVRFFDDEEAAYFYLFGILAAEAVHSGYLGPKTPSGQRNADSPAGNPPPLTRPGR